MFKEKLRVFIGLVVLLVIVGFVSSVKAQEIECNVKDFPHFFVTETSVRSVSYNAMGEVRGYSVLRNYSTTGQVQENWGTCNVSLQQRLSRTGLKLSESNPIKTHQQILVEGDCYPTKLCPGTYDETE